MAIASGGNEISNARYVKGHVRKPSARFAENACRLVRFRGSPPCSTEYCLASSVLWFGLFTSAQRNYFHHLIPKVRTTSSRTPFPSHPSHNNHDGSLTTNPPFPTRRPARETYLYHLSPYIPCRLNTRSSTPRLAAFAGLQARRVPRAIFL